MVTGQEVMPAQAAGQLVFYGQMGLELDLKGEYHLLVKEEGLCQTDEAPHMPHDRNTKART